MSDDYYWDGTEGAMAESKGAPPGMLTPTDQYILRMEITNAWVHTVSCAVQVLLTTLVIGGLVLYVIIANQTACVVRYFGATGCARLEWTGDGFREIQPWRTPVVVTPTHR